MNKEVIFAFIKKNVLALSCGLVAIIAIVLLFYPLGGMLETLQNDAIDHSNAYQALSAYDKARSFPITDPNQTDPGKLHGFPNTSTIALANEAVKKFAAASDQMLESVSTLNRKGHDPLVPDVLPKNRYDTSPINFGGVYKQVLNTDPAVTGVGDAAATPPISPDPMLANFKALNLRNDVLNGVLPPTPDQINQAAHALWTNSYEPDIITMNGKETNLQDLSSRFAVEAARLPQKLKAEVAKKHKMYVEADAFTVNPVISSTSGSPLNDIWYAQMQLWIQQDLATAIAEANKNATNIFDAEVKRLIAIQVPAAPMYTFPPASAAGGMGGGMGGGGIANMPATGDDKTAIPPIYTVSATGRYSNGLYDVVRFNLVVDVDSSRVNEFIESLSTGRMITITNQNIFALNADTEAARGYLYGPGTAVRLQLEGEELFMRSWTTKLMPDGIKIALGLLQPKPGMAGPGGMSPGAPAFVR